MKVKHYLNYISTDLIHQNDSDFFF